MTKISNIEIKKIEDLYKLNKLEELEEELKKLLEKENNNTNILNILGVVYLKKNIYLKAEAIFKKILSQNINDINALKNLGETYRKFDEVEKAIKYYEMYLKLTPNDTEIMNNLASCYLKNRKYELSIKIYENLNKINSQNDQYQTSLAFALIEFQKFNKGIKILEQILDLNITNKRAYSGYLFNQNYNPDANKEKINQYIDKYNKFYKKKNFNIINYKFEKNPKKVNLGFVSPDFRNHPVGYAIINVIKNLKVHNFNLFAYYNSHIDDSLTIEFKNSFDAFFNIKDLSEEKIINKIRSDGIHILIDLAGHTINNNLEIFCYKPAPVQISWLGYLGTTGLKEIKYKIGDSYIYPKQSESNFSEKLIHLPNIWSNFTVTKLDNVPKPKFTDINDNIIFGCFVTLRKINKNVIKLWSNVLKKFPSTKLHFIAPELHNLSVQNELKEKFEKNGIMSNRLIIEKSTNYKSYLESYLKVDITLDPFPWNGVTTSFESIWMGCPVFCLKGNSVYSKCAYSINKSLEMDDWIAINEEDYLKKLEAILSNKKNLLLIKKNLRENAIKHDLFNSKKFSKDLADKLNDIWKDYAIE